MNLLLDKLFIGWIIASDKDQRSIILCTKQRAQRADRQKLTRAFTVLHDAGDMERMIEDRRRVADEHSFLSGSREHVIDNGIVGPLKRGRRTDKQTVLRR